MDTDKTKTMQNQDLFIRVCTGGSRSWEKREWLRMNADEHGYHENLNQPQEPFLGSYPKSVMAVEALWILELASQRGFRERGLPHVSATGNPGGIDGARILDSPRTYAGPSERSEPAPGTESVRSSLEPREIGL